MHYYLFVIIFAVFCVAALTIAILCDVENYINKGYNQANSSISVQCDSDKTCYYRFTPMCKSCDHNCNIKKYDNCYVLRHERTNEI